MFRLLIVDDEYYVRVGIKSAIDWSEIGVELSLIHICDWSSGEIESTSEEISLRATVMRHSLMP